jgi:hypothetical protein
MTFTKTNWQDRIIERPNTYSAEDNIDGTITLTPVTGVVTQEGTALNANNLNTMEDRIALSLEDIENQKASITYVNNQVQNMNSQVQGFYTTSSALTTAFPSGNSNNYVVTGDSNKIYRWNGTIWAPTIFVWSNAVIADNTIAPSQTTFMGKTENLFDKTAITEGYLVASGGTYNSLTPNASTNVSGIIPAEASTTYIINSALTGTGVSIRGFTSTGAYLGTLTGTADGNGNYTFTTLASMLFIRFTYSPLLLNLETFMLIKGSTMHEYVPFGYQLNSNYLYKTNDRLTKLETTPVPNLYVPLRFDFVKGTVGELFDFGLLDFDEYPIPYCLNIESSGQWTTRKSNKRFLLDFTTSTAQALSKKIHLDDINTGTRLKEATTVINIVDVPSNPSTAKNILIVGDSFVAFGDILREFESRLHTTYGLSNYNLVGRQSKNGIKHEGTAGYDWDNFTNSSSIFYNSAVSRLDFINYMSTYCSGVNLDYVILVLGVNDYSHGHTIEQVETMINTFLSRLFIDYPSCKVLLVGQHKQPYDSYGNGDYYGVIKGKYMHQLNALYYKIQTQNTTKLKYVNMIAQFDYDNGFAQTTENIGRYSGISSKYITDSTHPSPDVGSKYYGDGLIAGFFNLIINQY